MQHVHSVRALLVCTCCMVIIPPPPSLLHGGHLPLPPFHLQHAHSEGSSLPCWCVLPLTFPCKLIADLSLLCLAHAARAHCVPLTYHSPYIPCSVVLTLSFPLPLTARAQCESIAAVLAELLPVALGHDKGNKVPEHVAAARARVIASLRKRSTRADDLAKLIGESLCFELLLAGCVLQFVRCNNESDSGTCIVLCFL